MSPSHESEMVVRTFLELLADGQADAAVELLGDDVVWRNTGLPTIRGRRVAGMLRDMERRQVHFSAVLHHVAADGPVVLTDRTDVLGWKRWRAEFWVCGTFEVHDGAITLWHDHFSRGNVLAASARGLVNAVR